jgi:hypothetical protein
METLTGPAVVALLAAVTTGQMLYAAPSCTNADLNGVYGMLATGNIIVAPGFPPPLLGPFARAGRVFADGKGNVSIANTASYNGTIIPESYSGTYTVSSDCSVDIRPVVGLPLGPGGALVPVPFEFIGALADNGNSAAVVLCGLGPGVPCFPNPLPTGNVIRVLLSRYGVNRAVCTNQDLAGDFLVDMSGTVVSGSPLSGPFARDGRLVFDGLGGFSGHSVTVLAGFIIQAEDISGSYSVDSLCNVSIGFTAGTAHTWVGTLSNSGNGADLIVAESGVVIAGTLDKQKPGRGPE